MKFDTAFDYLMKNEGGYSNDIVDKGGKTIYGVASKYHPKEFNLIYNVYLGRGVVPAKLLAKKFYRTKFWNDKYNLIIDSSLAFRIFDFGVNAGKKKAVKILQRSIKYLNRNNIKIDGIYGNKTLIASNKIDQEKLYLLYTIKIYLYYFIRPTAWKHLRGWTLRLIKRHHLDKH